jgi:hypothetical protein
MRFSVLVRLSFLVVALLVSVVSGLAVEYRAEEETTATVAVAVVDEKGSPVADATVTLHVGWARYELTADFDGWYAVESKSARTGADGRVTFDDLPEGAVATAYVHTGTAVGVAQGDGELRVRLGPPGSVQGRVTGKKQDLKGMRIFVRGGLGLGSGEGKVDKKTGRYEVGGLTPGPARVFVMLGNRTIARLDVEVPPGKSAKVETTQFRGKFMPVPDPQVDVLKAKLVDRQGNPMPGVQLTWSSRWMDGGMSSDEDGIVRLAGGGVAIGGPPYFLRLRSLEGEHAMYRGVLKKVQKKVAIVELHLLRKVTGSLKRGDLAVEKYRLFVVGPGRPGQVYHASVESGGFTVHVPDGSCRFVVGTVDGQVHDHALEVTPDTTTHEIRLESPK